METNISFRGKIVEEDAVREGYLRIEGDRIAGIESVRPKGRCIETGDCYIVPGFIDLHIHGLHRYLIDNGRDDLAAICRLLPQYGVTGFLPTLTPRPEGEDCEFLDGLSKSHCEGARILGFHMEGPFLKISGALAPGALSGADAERVEALIKAARPYPLIFSISPDVEGIERLLPVMSARNTPVFITHTAAGVAQTQRAIELGARHATHFYDVFPCPPVTEPGVRPCGAVEAILADRRVSVDFILDGVHVDPVAVKMALACKSEGPGCVCLITDANTGAGLEPGRFTFGNSGEIYFTAKGSPPRLAKDHTLAGSGLTMDRAFRNAMRWLDTDIVRTAGLTGTNPATVIGISHRKGKLKAGYDADFVLLDPAYHVLQTWIGGECLFKKDSP
ncbi:MAG: amidohydrolase family protein [Tannerella sp.]|nr:amidohydrolase family protein [Tannerella sp.]